LGDGTKTQRTTPVAVSGGLAFASLDLGNCHSCGTTIGGTAYCWGENLEGTLGIGANTARSITPVPVSGGLVFRSISAGQSFTCGETTTFTAYCWGRNTAGHLGIGTYSNTNAPAKVSGQP
jgi:alpha-tubulin suppressor-like RCC1 family protein